MKYVLYYQLQTCIDVKLSSQGGKSHTSSISEIDFMKKRKDIALILSIEAVILNWF